MKHSKKKAYICLFVVVFRSSYAVRDLELSPKIRAHFSSQICMIADDKSRYGTDGATASKRRGDVGARWAGWRS